MVARSGSRRGPSNDTRIVAVVVAYGVEPWLEASVACLIDSTVDLEVVVVDNGCADGAVDRMSDWPAVTVVPFARNLGFAGGCNVGAAVLDSDVLVFVNPDALVRSDCVEHLTDVLGDDAVGAVTGSVRLSADDRKINSAGNPVHYVGLSWSGGFEEPASQHSQRRRVTAFSGACFGIRTETWRRLGGFCEEMFAYYEDADLSVRLALLGYDVVYEPGAVVIHRYEFSRTAGKMYLLERNRLVMVLTLWPSRLLVATLPALVAFEVGTVVLAAVQGWAPQKLQGWRWLWRQRDWIRSRRAGIQVHLPSARGSLTPLLTAQLDPGNYPVPGILSPILKLSGLYWKLAVRLVSTPGVA